MLRRHWPSRPWVALLSIYLVAAPCSVLLPPLNIGVRVNPIHIIAVLLCLQACVTFVKCHRNIHRIPGALFSTVAAGIFLISLVFRIDGDLLEYLAGVLPWTMFFVTLLFLTLRREIPPFDYWANVLLLSAAVALVMSIAIYARILPIPAYRTNLWHAFTASRTAAVVDSTPGVWVVAASAYVVGNSPMRRFGRQAASLLIGLLLILLGGFRVFLLAAAMAIACILMVRGLRASRATPFFGLLLILLIAFWGIPAPLASLPGLKRLVATGVSVSAFAAPGSRDASAVLHALERAREIEIILESPWLGQGWDIARKYEIGSSELGYLPLYGHSLYTSLPARVGVPAAGLFIGAVLYIAIRGWAAARKERSAKEARALRVAALGIMMFLFIGLTQNLTSMTLTYPVVAIFIAYIIRYAHPMSGAGGRIGSARGLDWDYRRFGSPKRRALG